MLESHKQALVVSEVASDGGADVFGTKLLTFLGTMNDILSSVRTECRASGHRR
jgi:hypothetical protein